MKNHLHALKFILQIILGRSDAPLSKSGHKMVCGSMQNLNLKFLEILSTRRKDISAVSVMLL